MVGDGFRTRLLPRGQVKTITKHRLPEVKAIIFWLCNRNPERWKHILQQQAIEENKLRTEHLHKHQHEHNHSIDVSKLGKKELETLERILRKAATAEIESEKPSQPAIVGRCAGRTGTTQSSAFRARGMARC